MPVKLSASLTSAQIADLDGADKLAMLDDLCTAVYGPKHLAKTAYEDMGTPKPTWQRWRKQPDSIPTLALLYLQERARINQAVTLLSPGADQSPAGASDPSPSGASR